MIKKCPRCGSEKIQKNSLGTKIKCKKCGYLWKRNRRGLEASIKEKMEI